jgi:hypothetical protein
MIFQHSSKKIIGFLLLMSTIDSGIINTPQTVPEGDNPASQKNLARLINDFTPEHWKIYDRVMHFTPKTLYQQINGRAEYYIAYNVVGLTFASLDNEADSDISLNISIFDMGSPINAFGAFSGERSNEFQSLDLGREAYVTDANYYIWHGQYYIQIMALDTLKVLKTVGADIAKKLTIVLEDSREPVWGLTMLPEANRVPHSIQYFAVDAMGLDFMRNTFIAKYRIGETVLSAFLSKDISSESAQRTLNNFTIHAKQYGSGSCLISRDNIQLLSCDMGGSYDVIFQKDSFIAGVTGIENENMAIQAAIDLWKQI